MTLKDSDVQMLCLNAMKETYGDNCHYEHIHTTFFNEEALGLLDLNGQVQLIKFIFSEEDLQETSILHVFSAPLHEVKLLCEMLIQVGRAFGNKESF